MPLINPGPLESGVSCEGPKLNVYICFLAHLN